MNWSKKVIVALPFELKVNQLVFGIRTTKNRKTDKIYGHIWMAHAIGRFFFMLTTFQMEGARIS